ncbi:MAG: hypothetical protein ACKVIY_16855, partial [Acidimicrobiales bacterium]
DDEASEGRTRSLGASLSYGFTHAFTADQRRILALLHLFQGFVDVRVLQAMGNPKADWCLDAVRGLTRDEGIGLLDRADVGLLTAHRGGYYTIHPALPWFFKSLFDEYYREGEAPAEPQDETAQQEPRPPMDSRRSVTRAFVEAMGELGNYYHDQYVDGNRDVIAALSAEEANLLHARRLARTHGWWHRVTSVLQGLRPLYDHTGRRAEWRRLVDEIVPDFVDPATNCPLPSREDAWSLVTGYRVQLARESRHWDEAERLQRVFVDWIRRRADEVITAAGGRGLVLSRSLDRDSEPTEGLPSSGVESVVEEGDLRSDEWPGRETKPQQQEPNALASGEEKVDAEIAEPAACAVGSDSYRLEADASTFISRLQAAVPGLDSADRNTIRSLAVCQHELGEIQRERQQPECVAAYEESLAVAEAIDDRAAAATCAFNLGTTLKNVPAIRDLAKAEQWYRRSLELTDEEDRLGCGGCLGQIGAVAHERLKESQEAGEPEAELLRHVNEAVQSYQQALELLPNNAVNDLAVTHNQLGSIYGDVGDFDRALSHYRDAIRYAEAAGNSFEAGKYRVNVAIALVQSGRLSDAPEYALAALRDFQSYGDRAADQIAQTEQLLAHIEQSIQEHGA